MPAYKDSKTGKWFVTFRVTDYTGTTKQKLKRGFATKREALEYEKNYQVLRNGSPEMTFQEYATLFINDVSPSLKESTLDMRNNVILTKLIPAFGKKKLNEITKKDIKDWQNDLLKYTDSKNGKPYKSSYLKTIRTILSTMLNHAVDNYNLPNNVLDGLKGFKYKDDCKVDFWTPEEYEAFIPTLASRPEEYLAFEILYWTGIREGELLALTPADFDFEAKTLTINKTLYHKNGKTKITPPKTRKSNRTILLTDDLVSDVEVYFSMLYQLDPKAQFFTISKFSLANAMKFGCNQSGVKRIRIHDLRHSHVSLLINLGFSAVAIADRMGHESSDITYRYAHLFPSVQKDMVAKLNEFKEF